MFQTKVIEKIKTQKFLLSNYFPKIVPFIYNMKKCGTARQATHDNIILRSKDAMCMPDKQGKNTHSQYLISIVS
jgi:hypothetical protein